MDERSTRGTVGSGADGLLSATLAVTGRERWADRFLCWCWYEGPLPRRAVRSGVQASDERCALFGGVGASNVYQLILPIISRSPTTKAVHAVIRCPET